MEIMSIFKSTRKSIVSNFSDNNASADSLRYIFSKTKEENWTRNTIDIFSHFIDSRLEYLDSLSELPDNWISGTSKKPDNDAINLGKNLLMCFNEFIQNRNTEQFCVSDLKCISINSEQEIALAVVMYENYLPVPKIVMSPIPKGGLSFEFYANEDNAIYVTIPNEKRDISIEAQKDGFYFDISLKDVELPWRTVNEYRAILR